MRVVRLTFGDDPAARAAAHLAAEGIDPLGSLVLVPTQRFKTYFALSLLDQLNTEGGLSPTLMTNAELIHTLVSLTGKDLASETERLSLLYSACEQTEEIYELFPENSLRSFSFYTAVSRKLFGCFEELEREERDLDDWTEVTGSAAVQVNLLRAVRRNYVRLQGERNLYDPNFLLGEVTEDLIRQFFSPFDAVLLVAPVSLTRFEERVFKTLDRRLVVFYQDTDTYDFSRVLSFRSSFRRKEDQKEDREGDDGGRNARIRFLRAASGAEQVMITLSLVREALARGAKQRDIAVINSDTAFGRMLHEALSSLGIEVNLSAGLPVRTSPLYQFLLLLNRFFRSGLDTEPFLELLKNEFFLELQGHSNGNPGRNAWLNLRERIVKNRVFRLGSLDSAYIAGDEGRRNCMQLLHRVYASGSFRSLYAALHALCLRLETRRKTYAYYAVREILLDKAHDLFDLSVGVEDRPLDLLLETLRPITYALQGVYTRGVQILGLLETRGILFKNLIVPFFNEGYFPLKRENDLLLPQEVRDALGLPSYLDREELGFYYLDRLVEASENTVLISIVDKSGDIDVTSRYAHHYSVTEEGKGVSIRYTLPVGKAGVSATIPDSDQPVLSLPLQDLSRLDVDRLKACETMYFIARILGVGIPETLTRDISPTLVGQRVHRILAELYREPGLVEHEEELTDKLARLIETHFPEGLFYSREEGLLTAILKENLVMALRSDVRRFAQGYRVCPAYMERDLEARLAGGRYRIRGRIDRVDRAPGGGYVLIDYKTGRVPNRVSHHEEGGFREVQLGFYGLLLRYEEPEASIDGLCYFDLTRSHELVKVVQANEVEGYLSRFEEHLVEFLDRYEENTILSLADDRNTCSTCAYHAICRVYEP
jgi:RecB family exonuclease